MPEPIFRVKQRSCLFCCGCWHQAFCFETIFLTPRQATPLSKRDFGALMIVPLFKSFTVGVVSTQAKLLLVEKLDEIKNYAFFYTTNYQYLKVTDKLGLGGTSDRSS
jgi:hypothetical protein